MPITLPPISRRRFIAGSLAAAAGASLMSAEWLHGAADAAVDPHRVALLSDTHIAADLAHVAREVNMAEHLRQVVAGVTALQRRPAHVLLNGDLAFNSGESADYAAGVKLLEPVRAAGMPIHIGLGNHDNRERFWAAIPGEHRPDAPVKDKHVALIETERANWLMLDSLNVTLEVPGLVGPEQLAWLAKTLDAHTDKPALVMVHHNPQFTAPGPKKAGGLLDTAALLDVPSPRKQAKVLFFGPSHRWSHEQREDGLHPVNLPATAYVFDAGQPSG